MGELSSVTNFYSPSGDRRGYFQPAFNDQLLEVSVEIAEIGENMSRVFINYRHLGRIACNDPDSALYGSTLHTTRFDDMVMTAFVDLDTQLYFADHESPASKQACIDCGLPPDAVFKLRMFKPQEYDRLLLDASSEAIKTVEWGFSLTPEIVTYIHIIFTTIINTYSDLEPVKQRAVDLEQAMKEISVERTSEQ